MTVLYEQLEYSDEWIYLHEGQPFTGTAYELFSNGNVRCVFPFENGKEHGDVQEFFPSGQLMSSTPYLKGAAHGRHVEWYENGNVKVEREVEFGILLCSRTFDETGLLVDEYVRPEDDGLMEIVRLKRERAR